MEGKRRDGAGGPTTLLTRFAEELRRVLGRKGLRDEGVKGDFEIRPAVAGSRMCGKIWIGPTTLLTRFAEELRRVSGGGVTED